MKSFVYFFLVYLNLIKPKYKVSNEINFGSNVANSFFIESLKKSVFYLEYGSGSSTILADRLNKEFLSVESDTNFYNFLSKQIKEKNKIILRGFGLSGDFSTPLLFNFRKYFLRNKAFKYTGDVLEDLQNNKKIPDLILVDGRYRVLCALKLYDFFKEKKNLPLIILDDYETREYYKILEKFYKIRLVGRLGVIEGFVENDTKNLIKKYSLDCR